MPDGDRNKHENNDDQNHQFKNLKHKKNKLHFYTSLFILRTQLCFVLMSADVLLKIIIILSDHPILFLK